MLPQAYTDTVISLLFSNPFYGHVLSQLQPVLTETVPVAGVKPGHPIQLLLNQREYSLLKPIERVGVLKHEILHLILEHFARGEGKEHELFNLACDLAVNEYLYGQLPEYAVTVKSLNSALKLKLPSKACAEEYYTILASQIKVEKEGSVYFAKNSEGEKVAHRRFDEHINNSMDQVGIEIAKEVVRQVIKNSTKTCGNLPAELEDVIKALLHPAVNWRRILQRFLLGRGRMLKTLTYTRENRRYEGSPGRRKTVGLKALAVIDTSLSMSEDELVKIVTELLFIKKISGTKIHVAWGDTRLAGGPVPIENIRNNIALGGRGGTDFRWGFELADKLRVPLVVFFTDGYGHAPEKVNQRVLWALTENGQKPTAYGDTVNIA